MAKRLRSFVLSALLAGSVLPVHADTFVDWASHGSVEGSGFRVFEKVPQGAVQSFFDTYGFILDTPGTVTGALTGFQLPPKVRITDAYFNLYSGDPNDGTFDDLVARIAFPSGNAPISMVASLGAGHFFYLVEGNVAGTGGETLIPNVGGAYTLTSTLVPVPEPGMWAMFFTGGILLAFSLRDRRRRA